MKTLKVALVTTKTGKQYISMNIHTSGDAILLDYYRNAYSVSIVEAKKACEILKIDYQKFLQNQLNNANEYLEAMIDLYGDANEVDEYGNGLEVMAAKEKVENIKSVL